ncbi:DNA-3-methyladenine glycosylase [Halosimplex aquaticum]
MNGVDPAAHLAAGRTPRTATFFSGPGTVYVYAIHGHHALNFVTVSDGYPEGVLVRALEPTHGLETMRERRGFDDPGKLTSGPGRLTEALGITTGEFDDRSLEDTRLAVYETDLDPEIAVSGRIGVSEAADWPLRYTVADNEFVSRPVPEDEPLDHDAVERCYDRLAAEESDAHALD